MWTQLYNVIVFWK